MATVHGVLMAVRALLVIVISAVTVALTSASAQAYSVAGRPWFSSEITYRAEGASARAAARYAARTWNAAGVGIRFRATSGRANVLVRTGGNACTGEATVGRVRGGGVVFIGRCRARLQALVAAHEFGHVLGLGHERRRCALMNVALIYPTGTPARCAVAPLDVWIADPLQADDLRGARAISRLR